MLIEINRMIRKGGPAVISELYEPVRCRTLYRRVEEGRVEAAANGFGIRNGFHLRRWYGESRM